MFLTRSIRRKLCIVLFISGGLLTALFGAGFLGLWSYGSMVHEIEKKSEVESSSLRSPRGNFEIDGPHSQARRIHAFEAFG